MTLRTMLKGICYVSKPLLSSSCLLCPPFQRTDVVAQVYDVRNYYRLSSIWCTYGKCTLYVRRLTACLTTVIVQFFMKSTVPHRRKFSQSNIFANFTKIFMAMSATSVTSVTSAMSATSGLCVVQTRQAPLFFAAVDLVQMQLAPRFCRLFLENLWYTAPFQFLKQDVQAEHALKLDDLLLSNLRSSNEV